jgi:hypothetical protein
VRRRGGRCGFGSIGIVCQFAATGSAGWATGESTGRKQYGDERFG